MNALRFCLLLTGLLTGLAGCGEDLPDDANTPEFERPQIVPGTNLLCLSYDPVVEKTRNQHFVGLANRGRDALVIRRAELFEDDSNAFTLAPLESDERQECTDANPCSIRGVQQVFVRFFYEPPAPGWHVGRIRVLSNAQNFPMLTIVVFALARPETLGPDDPYDPGPRPPNFENTCPPQR